MTSWDGSGPPWEPQEEPAAPDYQQYAQNDGAQLQRGAHSGGYQDQAAPWSTGAAPGDGYGPEAGFQLGRRPAGYRPGGFAAEGFGTEDGQPGGEQNGPGPNGPGPNGYGGYGQAAPGQSSYPAGDLERSSLGQAGYGYGQAGYGAAGYDPSGYGAAGHGPSGYGTAGYGQGAYGQPGAGAPGYTGMGYAGYGYAGNGYAGNGYEQGNGYGQDTGYAANGYRANGYGANGYGGDGYGQDAYSPGFEQGTGQYTTQQYGAAQLEAGPYDPSQYGGQGRFGASQDGGWGNGPEVRIASPASAPVKRSGKALAGVVFGLLCAAGISAGAVQVTHSTFGASSSTSSPATTTTQTSPQATPSAKSSTTSGSYQLIAAATAGGYKIDKQVPATQIDIAQTVAGTIKQQVEQTGVGNVTSTVSGAYLIDHNLLAVYTGFNGSFSAQLIAKAFSSEASNGSTVNPGPHGGIMGCGVVSGGTICVWVTSKTLAVVEYFNAAGRVTMTNAKAATYALNIRDSVEVSAR